MTLREFVVDLFAGLDAEGIEFCVLRNHEGLPEVNVGNDIDLLVRKEDLGRALATMRRTSRATITSVTKRPYVTSCFIHGVAGSCTQVDFVVALDWLGVPYLHVAEVLRRSRRQPSTGIPVPDPADEAIISFFTSFLIGGFVKEKYEDRFIPVFRDSPGAVLERLQGRISPSTLKRLMLAIISGGARSAIHTLGPARRSLLRRALGERPLATLVGIANHYLAEARVHFSRSTVRTVAVFGPDGAGKSAVLEALAPRLEDCTKIVEQRHLRPRIPLLEKERTDDGPVTDPHGRTAKSRIASYAQLTLWLLAYWYDRTVRRKRNATLYLYDRYFHDVLVDSRRYRYSGSLAFARLLSAWIPRVDLAVILDAPPEVLRARKREVSHEETVRQRDEYLALTNVLPTSVVLDATQPLEDVVRDAEAAILEMLAKQVERRFGG